MKAYQNQVHRTAKSERSNHPQFNPLSVNKVVNVLYHVKHSVTHYDCDSCGRQLATSEFRPIAIACSDYTCRDCEMEREFTQVNSIEWGGGR
jgi:hypothetical protein